MPLPDPQNSEFFRPLVTGWLGKINVAKRSDRKKWVDAVKQCRLFFNGPPGFMFSSEHRGKFWNKNIPTPRFQMTLSRAFELVALFGPVLWAGVPHRTVEPKRSEPIPPELLQALGDQQLMQQLQQIMQVEQAGEAANRIRAMLLEKWLNYTALEMPGGGLERHGEMAITDALISGRGCLWAKPYQMPASGRQLTGCFWGSSEELICDPDYNDWEQGKWIARETVAPTWEWERKFKLKPGSLKGRATLESAWSIGERVGDVGGIEKRQAGQTNDLMTVYEVFSKMGPGGRLTGMDFLTKNRLEEVVGDYAYLAISPNVPYPLNCSSDKLRKGAKDDEVRVCLSWPMPTWADDKWPVAVLDFYPQCDSPYPIPPIAPGLGELKFLNVMVSFLCNRIWSSSRDFWIVAESAFKELKNHLENDADQAIIPISEIHGNDIKKTVAILQQPQTNLDAWHIVEAVSALFDKRVGLSELLYGLNVSGTQSRTAEDAASKRQNVSIRPDHMARKVEKWSSDAEAIEAFAARFFVQGQDVVPLMGPLGAYLWEKLVTSQEVEKVVREMTYTVAAGSARRPNKERDIANINQAMQGFFPLLAQYSQTTGDMNPVNEMLRLWGKASDMDVSGMLLQAGQAEAQQQQAQQQQQAEQQAEQQKVAMEQQRKDQEHQQKLGQTQQSHVLKLLQDRQSHMQDIVQDEQEHDQEIRQDEEEHKVQLKAATAMAAVQRRAAASKPKPSTNGSKK